MRSRGASSEAKPACHRLTGPSIRNLRYSVITLESAISDSSQPALGSTIDIRAAVLGHPIRPEPVVLGPRSQRWCSSRPNLVRLRHSPSRSWRSCHRLRSPRPGRVALRRHEQGRTHLHQTRARTAMASQAAIEGTPADPRRAQAQPGRGTPPRTAGHRRRTRRRRPGRQGRSPPELGVTLRYDPSGTIAVQAQPRGVTVRVGGGT